MNNPSTEVDQTDKSTRQAQGEFVRGVSSCREWITRDGSSRFPAEPNRYALILANNCPWCHRVALTWAAKGLQSVISRDVVFYRRVGDEESDDWYDAGWQYKPDEPGCTENSINDERFVRRLYELAGVKQSSVPILWDRKTDQVVNNESAEIIRMLNSEFNEWAEHPELDLYPEDVADEIDELNTWIYQDVNNGAYRAGFSSKQDVYEEAFGKYFAALDRLEERLSSRRFLTGDRLTEADLRLFPTLFRHDPVYFVRMKLSKALISHDYPHLWGYVRDVYQFPGVADASNIDHCVRGYFGRTGNGVIPLGPKVDFTTAHGREA